MDIQQFFSYVIVPLSVAPLILSFFFLNKKKKEKEKITPEYYLLIIFSLLLFIAVNYYLVTYVMPNEGV